MNRAAKPSTAGDSELQRAIDCGELITLYQPIVELSDGSLRYVEALLRWDHRALAAGVDTDLGRRVTHGSHPGVVLPRLGP